jgi:glycosyltransferase involved in cell wall biosynthesis
MSGKAKILLISYHFPPSAEVGGVRIANFAKRLPRFGWNPCVLTVKEKYLQAVDHDKLKHLGHTKIYRAGRIPTLAQVYVTCKKVAARLLRTRDPSAELARAHARATAGSRQRAGTLSMALRRYLLSFLSLPDTERNWIWPAVAAAIRIGRREKITCILTSCPPYSAHLVGLLVKWLTGIHWIADFRDPWMTAGSKSLFATCTASLAIERWLERAVVNNADRIIANTNTLCAELRRTYGSLPADRFACITNGYDAEFFAGFAQLQKERIFTITYTGSLYFGRTPEPLFHALHELLQAGAADEHSIRVRLVGDCQVVEGRPIDELIERYGLGGVVEVLQPVPYDAAMGIIRQSHLALLLAPNQPYQIPAKVYEYMGAGTRVLALAKAGATADLIRNTGIGAVFDPSDIAGIKGFIGQCLDEARTSAFCVDPNATNLFELDSISRQLADELERVCASGPSAAPASRARDVH